MNGSLNNKRLFIVSFIGYFPYISVLIKNIEYFDKKTQALDLSHKYD